MVNVEESLENLTHQVGVFKKGLTKLKLMAQEQTESIRELTKSTNELMQSTKQQAESTRQQAESIRELTANSKRQQETTDRNPLKTPRLVSVSAFLMWTIEI